MARQIYTSPVRLSFLSSIWGGHITHTKTAEICPVVRTHIISCQNLKLKAMQFQAQGWYCDGTKSPAGIQPSSYWFYRHLSPNYTPLLKEALWAARKEEKKAQNHSSRMTVEMQQGATASSAIKGEVITWHLWAVSMVKCKIQYHCLFW